MTLYLKQRVFTFRDRFTVYDADGSERYFVEGEWFSFGKRLHLLNTHEEEIARIRQSCFHFRPTYQIEEGERHLATVIREFTFFRQLYAVEGPNWQVKGNFFDHEYTVYDGDTAIATVSREWFTLGDAYAIHINDTVNPILALSVVLVIDACLASDD